MRKPLIRFLVYILLPINTLASNLALNHNARTHDFVQSSLILKGVAHSCLGLITVSDTLPCNPAFTPFTEKPSVGVQVLLSNGYSALNNAQQLSDGRVTDSLVHSLFNDRQTMQIEANSEVFIKSRYFNFRYSPMAVRAFSVVRNEANPEIQLSVVRESTYTGQTGIGFGENFFAGLQLRMADRRIIRRQFKLVELATQNGRNILVPKDQTVTFIEPAATYFFPSSWRPRLTALVANNGFVSQRHSEVPERPQVQFGVGMTPPLPVGQLNVTLDYRSLSFEEASDFEKLHAGLIFKYGAMELMGGLDTFGTSAGTYYSIKDFNAGLVYSTSRWLAENRETFSQTLYIQLGWQI
jgi:hypothetical protein